MCFILIILNLILPARNIHIIVDIYIIQLQQNRKKNLLCIVFAKIFTNYIDFKILQFNKYGLNSITYFNFFDNCKFSIRPPESPTPFLLKRFSDVTLKVLV